MIEPRYNRDENGCPKKTYKPCEDNEICVNDVCVPCQTEHTVTQGGMCTAVCKDCIENLFCLKGICQSYNPDCETTGQKGEFCSDECPCITAYGLYCNADVCECQEIGQNGDCSVCPCQKGLVCTKDKICKKPCDTISDCVDCEKCDVDADEDSELKVCQWDQAVYHKKSKDEECEKDCECITGKCDKETGKCGAQTTCDPECKECQDCVDSEIAGVKECVWNEIYHSKALGESCTMDCECAAGLECENGTCSQADCDPPCEDCEICTSDEKGGKSCKWDLTVYKAKKSGEECVSNCECADDLVCFAGVCTKACEDELECTFCEECANNRCQTKPEVFHVKDAGDYCVENCECKSNSCVSACSLVEKCLDVQPEIIDRVKSCGGLKDSGSDFVNCLDEKLNSTCSCDKFCRPDDEQCLDLCPACKRWQALSLAFPDNEEIQNLFQFNNQKICEKKKNQPKIKCNTCYKYDAVQKKCVIDNSVDQQKKLNEQCKDDCMCEPPYRCYGGKCRSCAVFLNEGDSCAHAPYCCADGLTCKDGTCKQKKIKCNFDFECPDNGTCQKGACSNGECTFVGSGGCETDEDCSGAQKCVDGCCSQKPCEVPCGDKERCVNGVCTPITIKQGNSCTVDGCNPNNPQTCCDDESVCVPIEEGSSMGICKKKEKTKCGEVTCKEGFSCCTTEDDQGNETKTCMVQCPKPCTKCETDADCGSKGMCNQDHCCASISCTTDSDCCTGCCHRATNLCVPKSMGCTSVTLFDCGDGHISGRIYCNPCERNCGDWCAHWKNSCTPDTKSDLTEAAREAASESKGGRGAV